MLLPAVRLKKLVSTKQFYGFYDAGNSTFFLFRVKRVGTNDPSYVYSVFEAYEADSVSQVGDRVYLLRGNGKTEVYEVGNKLRKVFESDMSPTSEILSLSPLVFLDGKTVFYENEAKVVDKACVTTVRGIKFLLLLRNRRLEIVRLEGHGAPVTVKTSDNVTDLICCETGFALKHGLTWFVVNSRGNTLKVNDELRCASYDCKIVAGKNLYEVTDNTIKPLKHVEGKPECVFYSLVARDYVVVTYQTYTYVYKNKKERVRMGGYQAQTFCSSYASVLKNENDTHIFIF